MSYEIKITKRWKETDADYRDYIKTGEDENGKPAYGFSEPREKVIDKSQEVLSQVVDDLDIQRVVAAINNLSE